MKKKKIKPNILDQTFKKNKLWSDIYYIENKIIFPEEYMIENLIDETL
jgi:hypothetical protein